jgi:hypothetical protein
VAWYSTTACSGYAVVGSWGSSWDSAALLVASREEDLAALYPFYSYAARVRRQGHEPEVESPEKGLDE